jgi:S-adenosylmethionine:tRNA ribosyltransferase-isomerase
VRPAGAPTAALPATAALGLGGAVRAATAPPEQRGLRRDEVALLVSDGAGHRHARFTDLPAFLRRGDLLVVNDSATLGAAVPAAAPFGGFLLDLATRLGPELWLAEPRWSTDRPGPLPLPAGARFEVAGLSARLVTEYPGEPRLAFVRVDGDRAMARAGEPIRYGHVATRHPLASYQTVFARRPGSAEMPSAGRPFSRRVLARLRSIGVELAHVTLHAGVSSLEHDVGALGPWSLPPEPFTVPPATARAVVRARARGGRVIAVGTTVVRALESAAGADPVSGWHRRAEVAPAEGFTRRVLHPGRAARVVDGLLTGFHEPRSSHLALLLSIAGEAMVHEAYTEAARGPYLWHEFGDVHLLLPPREGAE